MRAKHIMSATNITVDVVPAESVRAASEEKSTKEDSENSPENPGRAIWTGRKGKPKTRTGCKTCKIRRIKCDEAKPFCLRCTKTGRVCDGYLDPNIKKSRSLPPTSTHIALRPSPPSDLQFHLRIKFTPKAPLSHSPNAIPRHPVDHPNSTFRELRAIEYFLHKTTRLMSTWVISSFWRVQLPQISAAEPAVKHALVSLAVAHEAMERRCEKRRNDQSIEEVEQKRFACMHYHESVSQLGRLLQTRKDEDTEVLALMTGALFVMSKFMWGDFTTAVMHMHNEIEIYDNWSKKWSGREMVEGSLEWNVDNLVGRQCFKSPSLDNDSGRHRLQDEAFYTFEDMKTAKVALQAMFAEAIRLIRLHRIMTWSDNSGFIHDLQDEIDGFHSVFLSKWLVGFNDLVTSKDGRMTEKEEWESDILRTTQVSIDVWMYAGIGHQTAQPQPLELFDRLLSMGETLHQRWCSSNVPEDSATLSCDTGVVPPLLFISTHCSDATFRDRACKLLANSSGICTPQTQAEMGEIVGTMNASPVPVPYIRTEFIEVEVEEGTEELDLVLQPNRIGGWEIRHQDIV